jgi:hypothetical protein
MISPRSCSRWSEPPGKRQARGGQRVGGGKTHVRMWWQLPIGLAGYVSVVVTSRFDYLEYKK